MLTDLRPSRKESWIPAFLLGFAHSLRVVQAARGTSGEWLVRLSPFGRWLLNSLFLASTVTVLVVSLSSLAGFALAKYRFWGKRPLMLVMLTTMLLPGQVMLPGASKMMLCAA